MECPICEQGNLKEGEINENINNVSLGEYKALICTKCDESFTDSETTKKIVEVAMKKRSGN